MPQFGHRFTPGGSGALHWLQRNVFGCIIDLCPRRTGKRTTYFIV
jgi:hypothetical protein